MSTRCWTALAILAVALGVRAGGALWWQQRLSDPRAWGMPDSDSYWVLARQIAEGRAFEYGGPDLRIFRTPGYPILLAGLFAIADDEPRVIWARLLGAVLGTVTVGLVMWLGRLLFNDDTALIAGGLAACYPGAVAMSVFVLAEALFCPLMMAHLVSWVYAGRSVRRGGEIIWSVVAGGAAGLAVLTRPSWLLFLPFVIGCLVLASRDRWRHLRIGFWMLCALCVVMGPWWIRNYRVAGEFVPTTLQVGASLYDGLSPTATGASDMRFAQQFFHAQKREDAELGRSQQGFESRLDRRLGDAARAWARAHKTDALRLAGRKFLRMWNVWPNAAEFRSWTLRVVVAAGYLPVLVLGAIGAWRWGRRGWPFVLCVLPAVYFTCLHMVFVSSIRYRDPAMLVWIVLAAAVLADGWAYWSERRVAVAGARM